MDLKNKFQPKDRLNSFVNVNAGWGPSQNMSGNEGKPNQKSILNKFKRKTEVGKATPGQFKKYMLQASNVFFENRPELKNMEELKAIRWTLIVLWLILALSYFLIGRLSAYDGVCPKHARCGVFIHCAQFFEYDPASHSCILSSSIIHEIREISEAQIVQLQYNFGDNECSGLQTVPSLNIEHLFSDVEDLEKRRHYQNEANNFFRDIKNQEALGYTLSKYIIEPTVKQYSMSCRLSRFFSDPHRQLDMVYVFVALLVIVFVGRWMGKRRRIENMYNFLRVKVLAASDGTLNVTHAMGDLQAEFGLIDEATWQKINDLRTKNKEIGFYEDDFLYWKKV